MEKLRLSQAPSRSAKRLCRAARLCEGSCTVRKVMTFDPSAEIFLVQNRYRASQQLGPASHAMRFLSGTQPRFMRRKWLRARLLCRTGSHNDVVVTLTRT